MDSGCISTIVMVILVETLSPEEYSPMQWHMQAGNITTNIKVQVDFTLPALSATNVVTWDFHVDDFAKGRYDMILGQYLITELKLNMKLSEYIIGSDNRPFKGFTTSMVDLVA